MEFSHEQAGARRPLAYLVLVALCHAIALYVLLSQGILQRKSEHAGPVVYMDIRNLAAPRAAPVQAAATPPKPAAPARRIRQPRSAHPAHAAAGSGAPVEPALAGEPASPPPQSDGPRLDLDSLRALARSNDSKRELTPIEQLQAMQQRDHSVEAKVAAAAKRAQRPDCLTAHAGAGLFAPLLILKDTVTDKGCKW